MINRKIIVFTVLALLIIAGAFTYRYYSILPPAEESPYRTLLQENDAYAEGDRLLRMGKYDEASVQFQSALVEAKDIHDEGRIKYKIAISQGEGSDPMAAIALLKEIAANDSYYPLLQAYAVQQLGQMLSAYNTLEIKNEVFAGTPYAGFIADGDYSLARRKLFEYASSFYPLGVSELRIAKWYSNEIVKLQKGGIATSSVEVKIMKGIVSTKLANAHAYLSDIQTNDNTRSYTAEIHYRIGSVLGDMYLAGDRSFGDPEASFKEAIATAKNAGQEASAKYTYAVYLAKMDAANRSNDVQKLLEDFYQTDRYKDTNLVRQIANEKNGLLGTKSNILLLAKVDIRLDAFLKELGW